MSEDPNCAVWWLDLADHFGPNGIVGVLILRRQAPGSWLPGVWLIDTFLLSCRVMGRAVEDAFLATVAQELSAVQLLGEFKPTAKNGPVKELYPRLGFRLVERDADGERWQLDLASASLRSPEWFEIEIARSSIAAA